MTIRASSEIKKLFAAQNPSLLDTLHAVAAHLKKYFEKLPHLPVNPWPDSTYVENLLNFTFDTPTPLLEIVNRWTETLGDTLLHVDHPMYFGVFNPNPLFAAVIAEVVIAQLNPNLASTASARIGIAIEKKIICYFAEKAQWNKEECDGTFCSGGTEANLTAVLCALARHCPAFFKEGSRSLKKNPVVYVSTETHHSIQKSLKMLGLGIEAVRKIPVDVNFEFDIEKLIKQIEHDRCEDKQGILIVGTLGSTSTGTIDPLAKLANVAKNYEMDFHVDASWGAATLLLPEFRSQLHGIEFADSISIDAHKWFSVPMTCGIFITRHRGVLRRVFDPDESFYMPRDTIMNQDTEPYRDSLTWSRRFNGLKLLFCLMSLGESGYQLLFRHSIALTEYFRSKIIAHSQWQIINNTPLPVVCFHPKFLNSNQDIVAFIQKINKEGKAWITSTSVDNKTVLRVGFPNFVTTTENVDRLWELLQAHANSFSD